MSRRPSRLYRRLKPSGSVFALDSTTLGWQYDSDLMAVKITRGADSPMPGLAPTIMEWTAPGAIWPQVNSTAGFKISDALAAQYGLDPALQRRCNKLRVGTYETEDQGGTSFTTTLQAVHWSSLLNTASHQVRGLASTWVDELVYQALDHPELNDRYNVAPVTAPVDEFGVDTDWTPTGQAIDTWATGHGMLVRETRAGDLELVNLDRRRTEADTARDTQLPILRRQGLAPAKWHQSIDPGTTQYSITRRTQESNVEYTQDWPLPAGAVLSRVEPRHIDWSDTRTYTEQYRHYMNALNYASNFAQTDLASLRVDVPTLLTSDTPYDRSIVEQLLRMEVGDPVLIGADWPTSVRGRYFANQITEQITPAGWIIELALQSSAHVVGHNYEQNQEVPAYTWSQMNSDWANTAGTWADYAPPAG